jgi:hypothetical protein
MPSLGLGKNTPIIILSTRVTRHQFLMREQEKQAVLRQCLINYNKAAPQKVQTNPEKGVEKVGDRRHAI